MPPRPARRSTWNRSPARAPVSIARKTIRPRGAAGSSTDVARQEPAAAGGPPLERGRAGPVPHDHGGSVPPPVPRDHGGSVPPPVPRDHGGSVPPPVPRDHGGSVPPP